MKNQKIKRITVVALTLLLIIGTLLVGCKSTTTPTQPSTPSTPSTPSASTDTIKLLFASYTSENGFVSHGLKAFGADLEKKTNGRVVVEYSWSQALGTIPEYYDVLIRGVADVVHFSPYQTTGVFPLSEVGTLPFVVPTAEIATEAFHRTYKQNVLDQKFYEGLKMLFVCGDQGSNFRTSQKPVTTIADAKGVKIMIPGGEITSARVSALGSVPVVVTGPDVYPALQKGTVEGQLTGWAPMKQFKWCEVNKYATEPLIGGSPWGVAMNLDTYNKLPQDIQKIVDEMTESGDYRAATAAGLDELNEMSRNCFIENGGKVLNWEPAALEEMNDLYAPIFTKWIQDNEAKGLPATEAVDAYYYALQELGIENPAIGYTPNK